MLCSIRPVRCAARNARTTGWRSRSRRNRTQPAETAVSAAEPVEPASRPLKPLLHFPLLGRRPSRNRYARRPTGMEEPLGDTPLSAIERLAIPADLSSGIVRRDRLLTAAWAASVAILAGLGVVGIHRAEFADAAMARQQAGLRDVRPRPVRREDG